LTVSVYRPKNAPDIWGEKPELEIPSYMMKKLEGLKTTNTIGDTLDDFAHFTVEIDDLVSLVEAKRFQLNGKPIALSDDQVGAIRAAIVAAREATNAK
jgi:hypothetical protein